MRPNCCHDDNMTSNICDAYFNVKIRWTMDIQTLLIRKPLIILIWLFHQSIYFVKSDFKTPKTIENRFRNGKVIDFGLWQILSLSQDHCHAKNWISHSNNFFAFWRTYAFSKLDLDSAYVFQNAKKLLLWLIQFFAWVNEFFFCHAVFIKLRQSSIFLIVIPSKSSKKRAFVFNTNTRRD